jgi:hypothetical protein
MTIPLVLALLAAAGPGPALPPPPKGTKLLERTPAVPAKHIPEGARKGAIRAAVLDVVVSGEVPSRTTIAFNQALASEVRKLEGVAALGMQDIRDMLGFERQRTLLGCGSSDECLAEIGGALGVDELVMPQLTVLSHEYALTVRRVDLRKARPLGSDVRRFEQRDGEELLVVIGPVVAALYPTTPLKEGQTRGVDKEVIRRLNPPPLPRWAFFATAGGALAVGAGGGVSAYLMKSAQDDYNAQARASLTSPAQGSALKALETKAQSRAKLANGLFIGAGVLALGAGLEAIFTDWRGDREGPVVRPMALGGGAGLAVGGRF